MGDAKILKLRKAGMFSNVNEVIDQLFIADRDGYEFAIDWSDSCYKDESMDGDPWNYYFDDCFKIDSCKEGAKVVKCCAKRIRNIITPRGNKGMLLLPKDRTLVKNYIDRYIKLNSKITEKIDAFRDEHFHGYVIGLHIRGPAKLDGGVRKKLNRLRLGPDVPFHLYFQKLDKALLKTPDARVFLCSDAQLVIDECVSRYGDRIFTYDDATRSHYGDMHNIHFSERMRAEGIPPSMLDFKYPKYKLGVDILVEAHLLCETDCFIHGVSNVVNFVVSNDPDLTECDVFKAAIQ